MEAVEIKLAAGMDHGVHAHSSATCLASNADMVG
jgi:hypothetical protein